MERFFDILFSMIALIVLSPIFIGVIVLLRFTGEGEIFYFQKRIGKNRKEFHLYKFATMLKNSPNIGSGTVTVSNDPRVLPVGKLLRKSKINELPQLINIVLGDMSIVGPRPLTEQTFCAYDGDTQAIITQVRPGLSGVGSVIFRNEEDLIPVNCDFFDFYTEVLAPYKGSLEKWFFKNKSLYLYFLIILLTVWCVVFSKSKLTWKLLADLPKPPSELMHHLYYKN